ncbi:MAG: invasion associated locus B family protein [Gemmobacter sp.]
MTRTTLLTATLLVLTMSPTVFAQEATPPVAPATEVPATEAPATEAPATEAPATTPTTDDLALGTPVTEEDGIGSTYVEAKHGDWDQRCVRTEDGSNPCQLYQLLLDATQNPVAEFSVFGLPPGGQAVAGATAVVPLETLLTAEVTLQVDGGAAKKYPYSWCSPIGCVSRIGFTGDELAALKKGNVATLTIVPVQAPDQKVTVSISLKGFTAGYDAVNAANAN